jgi:hypothetical protein
MNFAVEQDGFEAELFCPLTGPVCCSDVMHALCGSVSNIVLGILKQNYFHYIRCKHQAHLLQRKEYTSVRLL